MQMFVLDRNPIDAANALCDAHIRVIGREVSMCLSAWYARNYWTHADELPYKPFNHPVVWQMANPYTRMWAMCYANNIFRAYHRRFGKWHASTTKLECVEHFLRLYDDQVNPLWAPEDIYNNATFSFIEKGASVIPGLSIDDAIRRYRAYYLYKTRTMRVPVRWTATNSPWWLEAERTE